MNARQFSPAISRRRTGAITSVDCSDGRTVVLRLVLTRVRGIRDVPAVTISARQWCVRVAVRFAAQFCVLLDRQCSLSCCTYTDHCERSRCSRVVHRRSRCPLLGEQEVRRRSATAFANAASHVTMHVGSIGSVSSLDCVDCRKAASQLTTEIVIAESVLQNCLCTFPSRTTSTATAVATWATGCGVRRDGSNAACTVYHSQSPAHVERRVVRARARA